MKSGDIFRRYPGLRPLVQGAGTVRVKSARGEKSLREFLAAFFSWGAGAPVWFRAGVRLRNVLARGLGITLPSLVQSRAVAAREIPFSYGHRCEFFTVVLAREEAFWAAASGDAHLDMRLVVSAAPLPDGRREFAVLTAVSCRTWRGRLYLALAWPMHSLGVWLLARAGARDNSPHKGS